MTVARRRELLRVVAADYIGDYAAYPSKSDPDWLPDSSVGMEALEEELTIELEAAVSDRVREFVEEHARC
jgi:hypothetical protein